jgi:hypothetical protein
MVITPSVADKASRCLELFMPMSRVQVSGTECSRSFQVKWSGTSQEGSDKTDGSYNPSFTYVYDGNSPNIGLGIHFRSQQQAVELESTILALGHKQSFSWSQPTSSGRVYNVADAALDQKQYKAVLLFKSRLSFRSCSLYYF